ncbi:MAG: ATP-binding protein [Ignavibacteriales bacterium]|nr:ATP-binding protein [Ignavibacteriales bacterium]
MKKQNSNKFSSWRNSRSDTTSIAYNMATDVVADPDGTFWIATFSCGIEHFDRIKNTFTHYKFPLSNPDYLSLNIVLCLYQDDENSLWAGTFGGLVHFDKTSKKLKVFSIKDGMSDNSVYGILEDGKHNLWLSTGNGITRFNHKTGECKTFGVNNGLQGYSFNQGAFERTIDGELFFGGEGGINSFFPDLIKHAENPPKIAITGVKIFDKDTRFEQSYYTGVPLDLPYYKNFLEIAFSAFDFSSPEVNRYSYYLEGLEKTWQAATPDHIVKYSNLAPGEYIFHVRAANSEGVWNNKSADLKISIRPPFWAAVWFRVLIVLAVLLAILFLYIRRVRYLQRETLIQQNFSKQLIELQEDERKRIASELHDELGQNLLIINNHAKIGLRDISSENIEKQLTQISETALASINEVRNIAYNLHPYQLDDLGLNNTVESLTKKIAGTTGIIFTVNLEQREKGIGPEAEINVFRIIQESINNAVKHAAAKNVTIKLHYREQMLHLNISDDGMGMNKEKLDRVLKNSSGFGLKGIQERVRHQKGSFSISSTENEGTNLHIKLPVPN